MLAQQRERLLSIVAGPRVDALGGGAERSTPEGIYARAKGRDHALTMLRQHGYLT